MRSERSKRQTPEPTTAPASMSRQAEYAPPTPAPTTATSQLTSGSGAAAASSLSNHRGFGAAFFPVKKPGADRAAYVLSVARAQAEATSCHETRLLGAPPATRNDRSATSLWTCREGIGAPIAVSV